MSPAPLLSKTLDPLLGIFTGAFAYYLHETHPRTAPPPDQTLRALASWKLDKWRAARAARLQAGEDEAMEKAVVDAIRREVGEDGAADSK